MAAPPSCTLSVLLLAAWAVWMSALASDSGRFWASLSSWTVAKPMVPSLEINPEVYGEVTSVTKPSLRTLPSIPLTAAWIRGPDSVPFLACTTTWSLSPAWAGKLALTMSWA